MKQRYVYIIRRGESIRTVETRAANARTLLEALKSQDPDRPSIGDGEDAVKQWSSDLQKWDALWHLERYPIGPPIPTDRDKEASQGNSARPSSKAIKDKAQQPTECRKCVFCNAGDPTWCMLHQCNTPRPGCKDYAEKWKNAFEHWP